jgi:undecaprenyl-phosphate 4-deoxy-4-formamido-L-arabinose transferase
MTTEASPAAAGAESIVHSVAIVVPIFQGEHTLAALLGEIAALAAAQTTPAGSSYRVSEVLLVHDGARDRSDRVMRELQARYSFVQTVWLSRNFGQHAATLAGMAGTSADWVVTVDEDGQQDPAISPPCSTAPGAPGRSHAQPPNKPPHGWLRNLPPR